jgi:hypothetical protein
MEEKEKHLLFIMAVFQEKDEGVQAQGEGCPRRKGQTVARTLRRSVGVAAPVPSITSCCISVGVYLLLNRVLKCAQIWVGCELN